MRSPMSSRTRWPRYASLGKRRLMLNMCLNPAYTMAYTYKPSEHATQPPRRAAAGGTECAGQPTG